MWRPQSLCKSFEDENDVKYSKIIITGHSLGGGLAMISGAQSKVPAVALSGPNVVRSRLTFTPAISKEQLDKYTFNIVPGRFNPELFPVWTI